MPDKPNIDVLDPEMHVSGDPHAAWTWLRENSPVHWHDARRVWFVTKHADVAMIAREHELFSSAQGNMAEEPESKEFMATSLLSTDPPLHLNIRRILSPIFTNKSLKQFEPRIAEASEIVITEALAEGSADLHTMCLRIAVDSLAQLLGTPFEDILAMAKFARMLDNPDDRELNPDPSRLAKTRTAGELMRYAMSYLLGIRRPVGPGLIATILDAHKAGQLTDHNVIDAICLFLMAGHEAPHDALGSGVLALVDRPEEMERLRNDRSLLPTAVEEILRWTTPLKHFARVATADTTLRGQTIRKGDRVVMFFASANRDAEVFEDPFRFDVGRSPNPHLAFSGGVHHCLGAGLARVQMRIFFSQWLDRVKHVEIRKVERMRSHFNSGALRFPIEIR